ncbi:MAG: HD domain-containing protein [Patescibacteria group bacterium]
MIGLSAKICSFHFIRKEAANMKTAKRKAGSSPSEADFLKRFELKVSPTEMKKIKLAYALAEFGHSEQSRDNGEPYFNHLVAATLILVDELGVTDVDLVVSELLHDMLEDSPILNEAALTLIFGKRVAKIVQNVTKPKRNDPRFGSDDERHQAYFARITSCRVDEKIVKMADRLHNVRTLDNCLLQKRERKIRETRDHYLPLADDIGRMYPEQAVYLKRQLLIALDRAEKRLGTEDAQKWQPSG